VIQRIDVPKDQVWTKKPSNLSECGYAEDDEYFVELANI
jgi:hypothetical protein